MTLDNPWRNTLKQNIASIAGPVYLKKYFTNCWAAGEPQRIYARKLGFKDETIRTGVYSCDFDYFHAEYLRCRPLKEQSFPKKIIFVGRYTKLKGVNEMWAAFEQFQNECNSDWELWCLGKGEYESSFPVHNKIRNFGFVQPDKMGSFIEKAGVFILPSQYEHWGVVVHEFAAAGFPLICSSTTSAAGLFLEDGKNGYLHEPENVQSLVRVFKKIAAASDQTLMEMGDYSAKIADRITPETWCDTVTELLNN